MPIRPPKLLLLDLDGTVYRGDDPIPGAAETIGAFRAAKMRVLFVTNRANRTVATFNLAEMSIPVCIPAGRLKENERHALVPSNAMYGEIMLRYLSEAICRDRDFTGKFHFSGASAV